MLRRISLAFAIALTIALLWASVVPSAGQAIGAEHHRSAHLISFAVLAISWRWAVAEAPAWMIALPVIGFSFLQEAIEIFGHGHPFESNDVVIDVLGASLGVMLAQVAKWMLSMK